MYMYMYVRIIFACVLFAALNARGFMSIATTITYNAWARGESCAKKVGVCITIHHTLAYIP